MGMLGDVKTGLSTQFTKFGEFGSGGTSDRLERHAPLSRYGTNHPVDKALWKVDRAREVASKIKTKKGPSHVTSVLHGAVSLQKGAK